LRPAIRDGLVSVSCLITKARSADNDYETTSLIAKTLTTTVPNATIILMTNCIMLLRIYRVRRLWCPCTYNPPTGAIGRQIICAIPLSREPRSRRLRCSFGKRLVRDRVVE
jgi:hypothetical protein